MKVDNKQSFTHPVLRPECDDFMSDQVFELTINSLQTSQTGSDNLDVELSINLRSNDITELIVSDRATLYLDFRCSDTLFQKTEILSASEVTPQMQRKIQLPESEIHGNLSIVAVVVARHVIADYMPKQIHEEFGERMFSVLKGSLLALSTRVSVPIDFDQRSRNSFIRMERSEQIAKNSYQISTDNDQITVYLGNRIFELYQNSKDDAQVRPYLFLGIYKDCIVAALEKIAVNPDARYRWMETLSEKLNTLRMTPHEDTPFTELNDVALQLLGKYGVEEIVKENND